MPRFKFPNASEFGRWLETQVSRYKKKYKLYYDEEQIVAVPATSTKPHEYGEVVYASGDEFKTIKDKAHSVGIEMFNIENVIWNVDREARSGEE